MQPKIIQLTNLLHEYRDPEAEAVKEFIKKHSADSVFVKRANTLKKLFKLKQQLVK